MWKTLLARFNKINEETGELNEDLNNVHKAFEFVNIAFLDAEDQIRPVDELLEELACKWKDLDKNTQMYLATQIAGVKKYLPIRGKSVKAKSVIRYANTERGYIIVPCNA